VAEGHTLAIVIPGLVPGISAADALSGIEIPGTSPGMTDGGGQAEAASRPAPTRQWVLERLVDNVERALQLADPKDRDDIAAITRKINGGTNGLAGRKAWLTKARKLWGTLPIERPKSSDEVRELQRDLVALGYDVRVDGLDGPKTKAAVEGVQRQAKILVDGIAGPATRTAINERLERRTAAGAPPADKTLIDALKTPEGLATGGGILTTILSAASSPGPLQWAIAAVVVAALAVGIGFLARRLRSAEA
jgi:hypothetical protein